MPAPATGRTARVLALTSGAFMRGNDVKALQINLRTAHPSLRNLKIDGEYGPATASAVAWVKRYVFGYPNKYLTLSVANKIGPDGQAILAGAKNIPASWAARAALRRKVLKRQTAEAEAQAALGDRALELALRRVGLKESPAQSNKVPELQRMARDLNVQPWIAAMGYPWCAEFFFLMYLAAGSRTAAVALRQYLFNGLYTVAILELAMTGKYGMRVVGWSEIEPGDGLLINFIGGDPRVDHHAMARARARGDEIDTVEGNTTSGNSGDQANGGMVAQRTRTKSLVRAAYRVSNNF